MAKELLKPYDLEAFDFFNKAFINANCEDHLSRQDPFPFRASSFGDCNRKQFFTRKEEMSLPLEPSKYLKFAGGHDAEKHAERILRSAGYEFTYPHGDQRGALDPPDYVWTFNEERYSELTGFDLGWGNKERELITAVHDFTKKGDTWEYSPLASDLLQEAQCVVHVDGVLVWNEGGRSNYALDKFMKSRGYKNSAIGLAEFKNQEGYSYGKSMQQGASWGYLGQMAIQQAGFRESTGELPDFHIFIALHNSADASCRYYFDENGNSYTTDDPDRVAYRDAFHVYFMDRQAVIDNVETMLPLAQQQFEERFQILLQDRAPEVPSEIHELESGPNHWMCKNHCPFGEMCHDPQELQKKRKASLAFKQRMRGF